MVIQCDPLDKSSSLRTRSGILTNKTQQVSIQCNPNRDILVIKIGENVFRDLKKLRKVEVHLGTAELVQLPAAAPRLQDAVMCNIYKAMSKAKITKSEDVKRKSESSNEHRDTKRLKQETTLPISKPSADDLRPKVKPQSEHHFKAKPIPFIVCVIVLGIVYCIAKKPIKDVQEVGNPQDVAVDSVRIAQDIPRILPEDNHFSHVFWRTNLDDPRVRLVLRWISHTLWKRRREQQGRGGEGASRIAGPQDDTSVDAILDNLIEDPTQQALAVVNQNSWTNFRNPFQVTAFAWNILLDFVYYWLTY